MAELLNILDALVTAQLCRVLPVVDALMNGSRAKKTQVYGSK